MRYKFQDLHQLIDMREGLKESGEYIDLGVQSKTVRVWHHSLTRKALAGSTAAAFANYHVSLGWPGAGYHFIIEPKHLIKGPDGKDRARIVWVHDPGKKTYHVGNSNKFALGICVAGDYRSDKLDEATLRSISELHEALVADKIGKEDKSHQQMPGYGWKECCVFDFQLAIKFKAPTPILMQPDALPDTYTIQEGDTFWSIAGKDGAQGIQVEDLIAANPGVDPGSLKIGQVIKLGKAKNAYKKLGEAKKPQESYKYPLPVKTLRKGDKGPEVVKLQKALNAILFKVGTPDGIFGNMTEDAVERFQKVYLPYEVDGIPGPNTLRKLKAVLKSKGY
jgi:N-acetylmuramoyl-L-alanine amidase